MIKGIEINPKWIAAGEAYLKENTNSGYPPLADVLADFEIIDLNDGGSKFVTFKKVEFKETLGKYFS